MMPASFPPVPPRRVTPRAWAVATAAALSVAAPFAPVPGLATAALAQEAGEGGEAGEAGVVRQDGTAGFLTELGLFEAAHRIVNALYQRGDYATALEQLEGSHHAYYEDLAEGLAQYDATPFDAQTQAFAEAIASEASTETVAARLSALLAALDAARGSTDATPRERVLALKTLLDIAAADYAGGVEAGEVVLDHEYRDAWGFVETVRARAQALATDPDADIAAAGTSVLAQLDPLAPLFPDLTATETTGDPAMIAVAAAWVEIIALRLP
jgi:hypothetical protein